LVALITPVFQVEFNLKNKPGVAIVKTRHIFTSQNTKRQAMKKYILTIAAASIILSACGNSHSGSTESPKISGTTSSSNDSSGSEKLTTALFIQKVWDYTKSPNDWKYLGSKPAIIDFYADWCGPCKIASPILDEIGIEYTGKILIYKVNTDQERELAQFFGITGIPAFLYIPANGKPTMMSGIAQSKEETKKMFIENIEKYLSVKK
jgi:thioredoxin 1